MECEELQSLKGVYLLRQRRFGDARGYFCETYNQAAFESAIGGHVQWIQDNESVSQRGVVRGLHFQCGDAWQAKLVRVSQGEVLDVVVDLRADSPTLGRWAAVRLSASEGNMLYIPRGFAHGFSVLSDTAQFQYKVDNHYAPGAEVTLKYNDVALGIDWMVDSSSALVSEKDTHGLPLDEIIARYAYHGE